MQPDRFFSREEVQRQKDAIDWNVYPISIKQAKVEYLPRANPCPSCGTAPDELFWLGIQSSNESWEKGEGRAGFLTICEKCDLQVNFFRDAEWEEVIRVGEIRL